MSSLLRFKSVHFRAFAVAAMFVSALGTVPASACDAQFAQTASATKQPSTAAASSSYDDHCIDGEFALREGALAQAAQSFERAAEATGDPRLRSDAFRRRGYVAVEAGDILAGRAYLETSVRLAKDSGDQQALFLSLNRLAQIRSSLDDQEGAAEILREAINTGKELFATGERNADRIELVKLSYNLVNVLIQLGKNSEARRVLDGTKPYFRSDDNTFFLAFYDMLDGELARIEGDLERSQRLLEASLSLVDQAPNASFRYSMFARMADTYEAQGDAVGMQRMTDLIYADINAMDPPSPRLLRLAHHMQGRTFRLSGNAEGAATAFEAAYDAASDFYAETQAEEMARLEALYQKQDRDSQISLLQADNAAQESTLTTQRTGILLALATIILAILAAYLFWQRQQERQRMALSVTRHEAMLEERTRIAREVHDTLLQGLMSISLQAQRALKNLVKAPDTAADALKAIQSAASDTSTTGRRAILRYRGEGSSRGIAFEIEEVAREAAGQREINIIQNCPASLEVATETVMDLLSIVRQSVLNAFVHGEEPVSVEISHLNSAIVVRIADEGPGFAPDALPSGRHGVRGMIERARMSRFELELPQPGKSALIVKAPTL